MSSHRRGDNPIPEFMWCQRSDRVYVTIKVSDCKNALVNVTATNSLEFSGHGHGARGLRDYELRVALAGPVVAQRCVWFVCGPSVRVRLEKAKVGPYWNALTPTKLVQCKVDWQSWIDEDEESEVSAAPNGFDVDDMQMMMVGESLDFYRDPDKFSSSEEEGEEEDSVSLDQGMNKLDSLQVKFRELELEKEIRAKSKQNRRELRERTRAAQKFEAQRQRDMGYGREVRELSAEESALIAGAATLRERLKLQKKAEKQYWMLREHHQMRPKEEDMKKAREAAAAAACSMLDHLVNQMGMDTSQPDVRTRVRKALRESALEAALKEVGYKDAAPIAAREIAAAAARAAIGDPAPPPSAAAALAAAQEAATNAGMLYDGVLLKELAADDESSIPIESHGSLAPPAAADERINDGARTALEHEDGDDECVLERNDGGCAERGHTELANGIPADRVDDDEEDEVDLLLESNEEGLNPVQPPEAARGVLV